jgi:hypothetical protein
MTGVLSEFPPHNVPFSQRPLVVMTHPSDSYRLDAGYQFSAIDDPVAEEEGYVDSGTRDGRLRDCAVGLLADVIHALVMYGVERLGQ